MTDLLGAGLMAGATVPRTVAAQSVMGTMDVVLQGTMAGMAMAMMATRWEERQTVEGKGAVAAVMAEEVQKVV